MLGGVLCFLTGNTELSLGIALVVYGVSHALYPNVLTTFGAESFPGNVRATATSTAWALNRAGSFLVPVVMLPLHKAFGPAIVGGCVAAALLASIGLTLGFGRAVPTGEVSHPLAGGSAQAVGR
jgi:hypothetical protein